MIQIFPAIDLIEGKCVRLTQGDYTQQRTYAASPLEMAQQYEDLGIKRLHLVDLDGAKSACPCNLKTLEEIATHTQLEIEWGGGLKSEESIQAALNSGATYLICGSIAVREPQRFLEWMRIYGADRLILGADLQGDRVAINGWYEQSNLGIDELVSPFRQAGGRQVICTDISKDGMLQGPNFNLYSTLQNRYPDVDITVSGGISSMDDIRQLSRLGLRQVIVGKAIYEQRITLNELKQWLQNESSPA